MKTLTLSLLILFGATFAQAQTVKLDLSDWSRCEAAKIATDGMFSTFVSQDLNCNKDSDCKWGNYVGGSICGALILNKVGSAGLELMKESDDYQRLAEVVSEEYSKNLCGPQPFCSQRPPGELKCSAEKQCMFQFD